MGLWGKPFEVNPKKFAMATDQEEPQNVRPVSTALCMYVRPSVSASFPLSAGQISTELWPLIDVRNWLTLTITGFLQTWYES